MKRQKFVLSLVLAVGISVFTNAGFASTPVVTITNPANGSQDSSSIKFTASASSSDCPSGIAAMRIYPASGDGVYTTDSDKLDVDINLSADSYNAVVQAWDNCGGVGKTQVGITVDSIKLPPPRFVYTAESMQGYVNGYIVDPQSGELTNNGQGPVWAH